MSLNLPLMGLVCENLPPNQQIHFDMPYHLWKSIGEALQLYVHFYRLHLGR